MKKVIVYFNCGGRSELSCCQEDETTKVISQAKKYFKPAYFGFNAESKKKFLIFFWKYVSRISVEECDCQNCAGIL